MMRHTIPLVCAALLMSAACKKDQVKNDGTTPAAPTAGADLLALIPADSPLVMVSTEPMPAELSQWMSKALGPLADLLQGHIAELKDETTDPVGKALLAEVDGKLNRAGLESLGISLQPRMAIYTIGLSLAVRTELADGKRLLAAIERVEKASGKSMPKAQLGTTEYRYFAKDEVAIALAVIGNEAIFGVMPERARDQVLPVLLGQQAPDKSLASTGTIEDIRSRYQVSGVGVGYIDIRKIAQVITGKASPLTTSTLAASGAELPELSATCQAEIADLANIAPRLVWGYNQFSTDGYTSTMALELRPDLAKDLAGVVRPAPGAATVAAASPALAIGLGIDVGKLLPWMRGKAQSAPRPQCEHLAMVGEGLDSLAMALSMPIPPMVNDFSGATVVLADIDMANGTPTAVRGYAMARIANTPAFIEQLKAMVPPLAGMPLPAPGGTMNMPVGVPGVPSVDITMRDNSFGVATGEGMSATLATSLDAAGDDKGPFLIMVQDYQRWLSLMEPQATGEQAMIMSKLGELLGIFHMEFSITDQGVVGTAQFHSKS